MLVQELRYMTQKVGEDWYIILSFNEFLEIH